MMLECPGAAASLLDICVGYDGYIVALKAYLDDSGDGRGASVVLGGAVADRDAWTGIESEWTGLLKGVGHFRMADCLGGYGLFKNWDWAAREGLISGLVEMVAEKARASQITFISAVCVLPTAPRRNYTKDDLTIPYLSCVDGVFKACSNHRGRVSQDEILELVFAEHSSMDAATHRAYKAFRDKVDPKFISCGFALQRDVPALQLADLIAHEFHQRFEDRDHPTEWWKRLEAAYQESYWFETNYTGAADILPFYFDFDR